jgi:hypothetical protein
MSPARFSHRPAVAMLILLALPAAYAAEGSFSESPHGSRGHGVWRRVDYPKGSCINCHFGRDEDEASQWMAEAPGSNESCFVTSVSGCHSARPSGAISGYPAQESDRLPGTSKDPGYFEWSNAGARIPGVENHVRWPGRVVWEDRVYSPHYADLDMPIKDSRGNGSCDNCHNVHGSASLHDLLDAPYLGITGSEIGTLPSNYQLCLNCHSMDGPPGMDESSRFIAYYYDRSTNPGRASGHGVVVGGGYVAPGARLPCFDCHNPHGSRGSSGRGANEYLLSDERPGWYGLTNIKTSNEEVRRFCFACHSPADASAPVDPVEGITLPPLSAISVAHMRNADHHCYDCHGRDYSSPTSHNVHNPAVGTPMGRKDLTW